MHVQELPIKLSFDGKQAQLFQQTSIHALVHHFLPSNWCSNSAILLDLTTGDQTAGRGGVPVPGRGYWAPSGAAGPAASRDPRAGTCPHHISNIKAAAISMFILSGPKRTQGCAMTIQFKGFPDTSSVRTSQLTVTGTVPRQVHASVRRSIYVYFENVPAIDASTLL